MLNRFFGTKVTQDQPSERVISPVRYPATLPPSLPTPILSVGEFAGQFAKASIKMTVVSLAASRAADMIYSGGQKIAQQLGVADNAASTQDHESSHARTSFSQKS